jgi:hypothetical protein
MISSVASSTNWKNEMISNSKNAHITTSQLSTRKLVGPSSDDKRWRSVDEDADKNI